MGRDFILNQWPEKEKTIRCNYEQCIHHEEGYCLDNNARRDCVEIALSVLCLNKEPECEKTVEMPTTRQ